MNEQECMEIINSLTPREKHFLLVFLQSLRDNRNKSREELIEDLATMYDEQDPEGKRLFNYTLDWMLQIRA